MRSQVDRNIAALAKKINKVVKKALLTEGKRVLALSKHIVPIDTGDLLRSGDISVRVGKINIYFDTHYAVKQHETPPEIFRHKPGRTWKYLERPFKENEDRIQTYITDKVRDALR